MRIALLHFNLSSGPQERNIGMLLEGIERAAKAGAHWVITPETALQGYFFTQQGRPVDIPVQPSPALQPIRAAAARHSITVFLGCAEQDAVTRQNYNSCLVIGTQGEIIGRHRKIHSHGKGAEGWAAKGTAALPVVCDRLTAGVLICADSYFEHNARQLQEKKAQVIIVPAAWPPGGCGGPPVHAWERCSRESGLPVIVCNQTGNQEIMDMSQAESAVITQGKLQLSYSGLTPAVLLFDWEEIAGQLRSAEFAVLTV